MIPKIVKEPLFVFLFFGFLIFIWFDKCNTGGYDSEQDTIVVNKELLLTMMQYQSKAFQKDVFAEKFNTFSASELNDLVDNYIKEEVLYREALKLNLDDNDYIIKRRLMQKVDFLYNNMLDDNFQIEPDSLEKFYSDNQDNYKVAPTYTFSHVFIKDKGASSESRAEKIIASLNSTPIETNKALQLGDRFLYYNHYVDRDIEFIKSHFGNVFSDKIMALQADTSDWAGPFASDHGLHLVLLTDRKESKIRTYKEVSDDVQSQYKRLKKDDLKNEILDKVIRRYKIVVDL